MIHCRKPSLIRFAAMLAVILAMSPLKAAECPDSIESPVTVTIPAGSFIMGSTREERETAYLLDEKAYGNTVTRKRGWYEKEPTSEVELATFEIMRVPVTNQQYAIFLSCTGRTPPTVTREEWDSYGLIHPFERAQPYIWTSNMAPEGRQTHPVVMVTYDDANAYAEWLGRKTGFLWRLPTEEEWEKAARGTDARYFPWGNRYDARLLNSHDAGPFGTTPVGSYPDGASPYGMLDAAGNVFEWTSTSAGKARHIVKGGSWDDKGCGVCRPAAHHSRPDGIKHIIVGFRLVRDRKQK